MPGYPSWASPTRARKSGMRAGSTPNFLRTPSASRICIPRRSTCTTRSPRTHCARSLSLAQTHTFSTRSSSAARRAAEASRSGLDHLEHGVQHPDDGAEGLVLALIEAALAVELAEQLVGAVEEVN